MKRFVFLCLALFHQTVSGYQPLTESALFYRCYGQITQMRPAVNDPLLLQVKAGSKLAVDACMEVLDRARFGSDLQQIGDPTDPVAKAVIRTFHGLHASWFTENEFNAVGLVTQNNGLKDIYDTQSPALYYTKALFRPNTPFQSIVTDSQHLRAIRVDPDPSRGSNPTFGPYTGTDKKNYIFDNVRFASVGEIVGVEPTGPLRTPYSYIGRVVDPPITGTIDLGGHFGGGILGSTPFLLENVNESLGFQSDGAEKMPRKWARAIFNDLLCRSLPVIRFEDAAPYYLANSSIPFRRTQACTQCHASMDRMSAVIRGFTYVNVGRNGQVEKDGELRFQVGGNFPGFANTDLPPRDNLWPAAPDTGFYRRPADGVVYFRNYKGVKREIPVRGISALGQALAGEADLYLCAAKHYYEYFTGVEVTLTDNIAGQSLSPTEKLHFDSVEALGLELQKTQSLRTLIRKIMLLPQYKRSDFGAERGQP